MAPHYKNEKLSWEMQKNKLSKKFQEADLRCNTLKCSKQRGHHKKKNKIKNQSTTTWNFGFHLHTKTGCIAQLSEMVPSCFASAFCFLIEKLKLKLQWLDQSRVKLELYQHPLYPWTAMSLWSTKEYCFLSEKRNISLPLPFLSW